MQTYTRIFKWVFNLAPLALFLLLTGPTLAQKPRELMDTADHSSGWVGKAAQPFTPTSSDGKATDLSRHRAYPGDENRDGSENPTVVIWDGIASARTGRSAAIHDREREPKRGHDC